MTSPTVSSSSPSTPTTAAVVVTTGSVGQKSQQAAGGELKNEVSPSSSISTTTPKSFNSQEEISMDTSPSSPVSDTHNANDKKSSKGRESHDGQVQGSGANKPVEEEKSKESNDQVSSSSSADNKNNTRKAIHEDHKRKRDGEAEDRERRDFKGGKKARKNMGETDFPKRREDMTPEQLKARIKRQIEYYLSDESLSYDAFFQGVMKEAAQQGKGESLEMRYILSCPRIKSLDITKEEILDAIQDSSLVQVKEDDEATYLYRSSPLPELRERSHSNQSSYNRRPGGRDGEKGGHFKSSHQGGFGKNPHAAGCFLKVFDIPESITQWQAVKDSLKDALPKEALVRYVSRIDTVTEAEGKKTRRCWVYLGSFEKDREVLEGMQPIKVPIGGDESQQHTAQAAVLTDQEIRMCVQDMPPRVRTTREKDLQTLRRQLCALPLTIGGVNFTSVDHLRSCINEFLQKTAVNQTLKPGSAAERAVKGLLDYHPKAFMKKGGRDREVAGIKVGLHEKTNNQTGERMKCFFVVRKQKNATEESEGQDEEDFSVQKCISELAKDPPCDEKALQELLKQRYEQSAQQREHQAAQAEKRRQIRENATKTVKPHHPQTKEEKEKTPSSSQPSSTGADRADAGEKKAEEDGEKAGDRKEEKTAEENEEKKSGDASQSGSEATDGDKQNKEGTEG